MLGSDFEIALGGRMQKAQGEGQLCDGQLYMWNEASPAI